MPARAGQDDGIHTFGRFGEECIKVADQRLVHCVPLFRAVENDRGNVAVNFHTCGFAGALAILHRILPLLVGLDLCCTA